MKTQFLVSKQEKKILLVAVCCILFSFIDNLWLHNFLVQSKENVLLKPISGLIVGGFFMTVCSILFASSKIYVYYIYRKNLKLDALKSEKSALFLMIATGLMLIFSLMLGRLDLSATSIQVYHVYSIAQGVLGLVIFLAMLWLSVALYKNYRGNIRYAAIAGLCILAVGIISGMVGLFADFPMIGPSENTFVYLQYFNYFSTLVDCSFYLLSYFAFKAE